LERIVYWVEKSGSMATMLCSGRVNPGGRSLSVAGKAGEPRLVGFRVAVSVRGSPLRWMASS
jgi:hypothetical protein